MTAAAPPPVVNVVGRSDSGKTGVMEALVRALTARGWHVATVKHHHHGDIDTPGKDSWRHTRAGAVATALIGQTQYAIFRRVDAEPALDAVVAEFGDVDIVLVEGFKQTASARIEVVRYGRSEEPVTDVTSLVAMVTDVPSLATLSVPVFGLNDHDGLADFVERAFLGSRIDPGVGVGM